VAIHHNSHSGVEIEGGTSFAAPLVSGILTTTLADLELVDIDPTTEEIQQAVFMASEPLDDGTYNKLDGGRLWEELYH
jgi:hypothetical protein